MKCFLTVCTIIGAGAAISYAGPLTLEECLSRAQSHSEALSILAGTQDEAEARLRQARGAVAPNMHFLADKTLRDTDGGRIPGDQANARFALTQPLFAGGRLAKNVDLARNDRVTQRYLVADATRALREQVITAFYTFAAVDARLTNIRETAQLMTGRIAELRGRARLGKSRDSEVLMTESQASVLLAQYEKSSGDRSTAAETLAFLAAVSPDDISIETDTTTVTGLADVGLYSGRIAQRADILAARQAQVSQSLRVAIAKGGLFPSLDLTGSWYTLRSGALANVDWEALLRLDVPLFQGGGARGRVAEEQARLRESELAVALVTRQAETLVRTRYEAASSSIKQAAAFAEAFEKAAKSYRMQMRDYQYGLVNNLDVIQALLNMLDVKQGMDAARMQALRDTALLDESVR